MTLRFPHWNKAGPYPVLVVEDGQNGGSDAGDGCSSEDDALKDSEVREEYVVLSARAPQGS